MPQKPTGAAAPATSAWLRDTGLPPLCSNQGRPRGCRREWPTPPPSGHPGTRHDLRGQGKSTHRRWGSRSCEAAQGVPGPCLELKWRRGWGPGGAVSACRFPQGPVSERGAAPCAGHRQLTPGANPNRAANSRAAALPLSHVPPPRPGAGCCVKGVWAGSLRHRTRLSAVPWAAALLPAFPRPRRAQPPLPRRARRASGSAPNAGLEACTPWVGAGLRALAARLGSSTPFPASPLGVGCNGLVCPSAVPLGSTARAQLGDTSAGIGVPEHWTGGMPRLPGFVLRRGAMPLLLPVRVRVDGSYQGKEKGSLLKGEPPACSPHTLL